MTPGPRELLGLVCDDLDAAGLGYALIGATALVAHGFVRATDDLDLLVLDEDILRRRRWHGLEEQGVHVDVRRGDDDDPLLGVIRLGVGLAADAHLDEATPAIVDLVMVRGAWAREILTRASTAGLTLKVGGRAVPCVSAADLVLLKLYGGGTKDRGDIEELLAGPERQAIIDAVESRIGRLPEPARALWGRLRPAGRAEP